SEHNVDLYPIVDFVEASHLRRNLKLNDEAGIGSLPDMELFKNLTLMGYNISRNQKFTFQKGQFSHKWKYLIHTIMQCLSPKSTGFNEFSSNIAIALGEGSGTPTEPHYIPSPKAQQTSLTTYSSLILPPITTANIPPVILIVSLPTVTPSDIPHLRQYTKRARIAQSSALPPVVDESASPLRDVSHGEACPTVSSLEADQDRANKAKTSTLPSDSAPRFTSLDANEGSMQQKIDELTALCTSLQRQHSEMISRFEAHELEINSLKAKIKLLEDKDRGVADQSRDDAPIKGRRLDVEEEVAKRVSDDTEEMATVLTSMDAVTVLSSGVAEVPTGSGSIPTASPPATEVPTGSDVVPTTGPIFATAIVVTPYTRRKGKENMIESNEIVAKYLQEYHQFATELPIERRIELISDLVRYQDNYAKEEAERFKRKGIRFKQESVKKLKTSEEVKATKEVTEEKVKEMIQLVPVDEIYVEALQVKHPIIDWKVHTEGQRSYWKITRLGGSSANYQFFMDMLKHLDREDLNKLWRLVKESLSIRSAVSDKEMELWVELKRLYKLQVENYSQMANDLIMKIYKIANYPSQQVMEFPLLEEVSTASKESTNYQKKRDATTEKIRTATKFKINSFRRKNSGDLDGDLIIGGGMGIGEGVKVA
nr:hypothetical protein [Tanacetum cinerariifolium]